MLAYVFWHWMQPGIDRLAYETGLRAFHDEIRRRAAPGFRASVVLVGAAAPWTPATSLVYEDWYVTDGSAALDALDEAAISGRCRTPHDAVASAAAGGTAGLYRHRAGPAAFPVDVHEIWVSKPAGTSYGAFDALVAPLVAKGAALWCRQMVLGPTPEFCLVCPSPMDLPAPLQGLTRKLSHIT